MRQVFNPDLFLLVIVAVSLVLLSFLFFSFLLWFRPSNRADSLCRFFLLWSPDVYGEPGDAETVAKRGFELITEDLEWEEQSPVRRLKPAKKPKATGAGTAGKKGDHDVDDDDDPLGVTAELAKESWEVQCC